jgi:hypothetical protein
MKLAAIYNCWDALEFLEGSIKCLIDHVDKVIIVYQATSNYGELYPLAEASDVYTRITMAYPDKVVLADYIADVSIGGAMNERKKRNKGLSVAKDLRCTHFLHIDCDEFYKDFASAKAEYISSGAKGSVCELFTYFGKPTWRFETKDGYYVPFIHELNSETNSGSSSYPFYVDPTRTVNNCDVVLLKEPMHHFSWVRRNIERKARNSSATDNIQNGTMLKDYYHTDLGPGFYVKDYDKKLIEVEDYFCLGDFDLTKK